MLARAPPRPCSTAGARGPPRAAGGVKLVAARQSGPTTTVVAAAAGERRTMAEAANGGSAVAGISTLLTSTVGKSTNILWHDCPIGQNERQNLLNQKGCVVWITGLSGSVEFGDEFWNLNKALAWDPRLLCQSRR